LIELLVVIAIMMVMASLLIPAFKNITGGFNITSAAEELAGTINLARQRATASSHNTSIRFYRDGSASGPFKSYQIWEQADMTDPSSWNSKDKEQKLAQGLIASADTNFSPLLNLTSKTTNGRTYAEFYLTPNGSVAVPKDKAFLTIHSETDPKTGGAVAGLPPNFATVSIEPFNGRSRVYRP